MWAGVGGAASPKKILNIPEQTSGTLEIFSRVIVLGTLLQICENSVFSEYDILGDNPGLDVITC